MFGTKRVRNWKIVPNPLTLAANIADLDNELILIIELEHPATEKHDKQFHRGVNDFPIRLQVR